VSALTDDQSARRRDAQRAAIETARGLGFWGSALRDEARKIARAPLGEGSYDREAAHHRAATQRRDREHEKAGADPAMRARYRAMSRQTWEPRDKLARFDVDRTPLASDLRAVAVAAKLRGRSRKRRPAPPADGDPPADSRVLLK